ncbi:MAG: hypothetical protein A3B30_01465 [Candidatus Komeilibacteria bacterium RIFCSPLOWO2_01_FULL_52_15]|uniref:Type 4a pilus biogenesis protein PilO n=2 Tax=Candidatus Komeiliibacteriota TaxID=1817908 RepID=A0A1G2BNY1_9BACT|nr:MAG: hypothetical protein A2677_00290 [Candidatus Komeilibacteria bacterium RIFCSPHIGHO2_01_FULL_52_14]OGY90289.1 MAG: hypothetical protein A3B30_01465 [Candidatus Komeilibacteria bacterium RIFCSPLOWO2_01_FULL_52_15]
MELLKKTKKPKSEEILQPPSLALQIINRYIRWVVFLVIVVTLFVGYWYVISRKVTDVQSVAAENLDAKQQLLSFLEYSKGDLDRIVNDFSVMQQSKQATFTRLNAMLPTESRYEELFTMVNTIVEHGGMKMTSINFGGTDTATQAESAPGDTVSRDRRPTTVNSITISITIEGGTYDSFKTLLSYFERNIRLIDIKSVAFDGGAYQVTSEAQAATPHYDMELITYFSPSTYAK